MQPAAILVSDDSEDLSTRRSTETIARHFGADYAKGPGTGLGSNRNACVGLTTTNRLSFIDDDVIVSSGFVERASRADVNVITTGWELNFLHSLPEVVTPHNPDFLGFQRKPPAGGVLRSIVINATVFPTRLFRDCQFNVWTRYGYEEVDLARSAVSRGWVIMQDPSLWVEHHPSPVGREDYDSELAISRMLLTRWAYANYECSSMKALMFRYIAAAHFVAGRTVRGQSVFDSIRTAREVDLLFRRRQASGGGDA